MHCALAMSVASATAIIVRAAEVAHFVEYIESDGTGSAAGEYVLLEYKPTAQSVVEMDFVPLDLSVNNTLFCARGAYVTYKPFTLIWYAGSGLRWDYNRTTAEYEDGLVQGWRHTLRCGPDGLWIDGVKSASINVSPANYTPANKMVLFGSYLTSISTVSPAANDNWSAMRLYSFKVWDDNGETLKIHLRPCVDTDGVACLYDIVNERLYYNGKSGKALTASASWSSDCLAVSSTPAQYGVPSPNGLMTDLAPNDVVPVSCPAVWTNDAGTASATCTGWKLYDDAGNVVSNGTETAFTYIHPGASRRLEWQWATEYRIDASTAGGGTVAPASQWAASGATATVTATPSATHTFHHWTGDLPAGASTQSATISLTVTAPAALQAVFSKAASSGTRTWIGGDSGDWNTAANWDPEGVPAANETVVFAESAAVAPPASFAGTVSVAAGATVAATYAAPATFSIAVAAGGRFEKHGAAEAIISPADGDYPGTVAVCEGSAAFAGNGPENAPGLFGPLEVAAGATARVVESPFNMRHAVVTYAKFDARDEATKTAEFNTYAKLQAKWEEFAAGGAFRKSWVPSGLASPFALGTGTAYLPGEITVGTNKQFAFIAKAIILFPTSQTRRWYPADSYGSARYNIGSAVAAATDPNARTVHTLSEGWQPFAVGFGSNGQSAGGAQLIGFRMDVELPSSLENVLSHGTIWNGVCFGGLSLPAGATLRVEDGQAVGFAFADAPSIAGSVVAGGPDACFSLMLDNAPLDLATLADFAGKIEVGVHGRARITEPCGDAAFSIFGDGEVVADADGVEPLLPAGFNGTVRVPAGRTFVSTDALGSDVVFVGDGTVTVTPGAPRPPSDFRGRVVLSGAQTAEASAIGLASHASLEFGAGSALTFGGTGAALSQGVRNDFPAFAEGWTLGGTAAHGANGTVSLTDGASQTATVWLPSYRSLRADVWQLKFTYSATATAAGAALGDGFAFLLRDDWDELPVVRGTRYNGRDRDWICNTSAADTTCFGFTFRPVSDGKGGFSWVAQGYPGNGRGATFARLAAFDPLQPIDFTVSYVGDVLCVRMEQGATFAEFRRVFTQMYTSGNQNPRLIGFAASTWTAANGTLVQGLSNLSGWYRTEAYAGNCEAAPAFDISAANWALFKNAVFTNDASSIQLCSEPVTAGVAIARAPLPLRRKFRLSCHVATDGIELNHGTTYNNYVRSFFATMLQNQGLAAGDLPPSGGSVSGNVQEVYALPTITNSVAGYFQSYTTSSQSALGYRTAARSMTGQTTADMHSGTSEQNYDYTISHDGYGGLTETLAYGSTAYNASASFAQLSPSAIGDEFHLMLSGYCGIFEYSGVNHCAQRMRVDDLSVVFPLNHDAVFDTPVAFNGDATFVVGNIETNAATATASFPSVTIGAGATLTVAAEDPEIGVRVGMGVALGGPAGLTAAEGAVVRLDTVTVSAATPATLTLAGSFVLGPDGLTVVIIGGRQLRAGFRLLDIANAVFANGIDASRIHFVDEEGNPLDSFVAVVHDDSIRVSFRGGTMLLLR
ncbi:MAG: hypothetical protein IJK04_12440 [Kiritimatiellae bacterium]|nr:hypothetical protein [Kiritimatiellia bacterium]